MMKPRDLTKILAKPVIDPAYQRSGAIIEFEGQTYEIDGLVFPYLDKEWLLARKNYPLDATGPQKAFGQMTLLAGGIKFGQSANRKVIRANDILKGWHELRVCGLGVPPHQCIGDSIIDNRYAIIARKDMVARILADCGLADDSKLDTTGRRSEG